MGHTRKDAPVAEETPLLLRALRRQPVPRPPVWIMRQAGRYMPEFRAIRAKHGFLEVCKTPDLATEVTLQPIGPVGVDAAIIFSDILIPVEQMGMGLVFDEKGRTCLSRSVRLPTSASCGSSTRRSQCHSSAKP